jgi:hypothetical protein
MADSAGATLATVSCAILLLFWRGRPRRWHGSHQTINHTWQEGAGQLHAQHSDTGKHVQASVPQWQTSAICCQTDTLPCFHNSRALNHPAVLPGQETQAVDSRLPDVRQSASTGSVPAANWL